MHFWVLCKWLVLFGIISLNPIGIFFFPVLSCRPIVVKSVMQAQDCDDQSAITPKGDNTLKRECSIHLPSYRMIFPDM